MQDFRETGYLGQEHAKSWAPGGVEPDANAHPGYQRTELVDGC
jgi:hypothetical protein